RGGLRHQPQPDPRASFAGAARVELQRRAAGSSGLRDLPGPSGRQGSDGDDLQLQQPEGRNRWRCEAFLRRIMFEHTSRYFAIEPAFSPALDGRDQISVRRGFLPAAAAEVTLVEHTVTQGERLDHITARYLTDPEQFWRVCDANNAMRPE